MTFLSDVNEQLTPGRIAINDLYRIDETTHVNFLLEHATLPSALQPIIRQHAEKLVQGVREAQRKKTGLDAFMNRYHLASDEGIALMCLAEALLRIPDKQTMDRFIRDKISTADWESHIGKSDSFFVNATTWGLMLTGKLVNTNENHSGFTGALRRLVTRSGEPVVRRAVMEAMKILGKQFVMGRTIKEALTRAITLEKRGYRFSYDMLGEAAKTDADAERYFNAYLAAIEAIGYHAKHRGPIEGPGISVKLSALYPHYDYRHARAATIAVVPKLTELCIKAKQWDLCLTIDAEEADRLDLSLDIITAVFSDPALSGWNGFGVAVQSYQKRAWAVLDELYNLAHKHQRIMMIRLIKGAYWDSEIKRSQELGLEEYPVFTQKISTDVSFLACTKKLLGFKEWIYPMFATHNAYSVAAVHSLAEHRIDYEFQCLHGMGLPLYDQVVGVDPFRRPCRIYAPVGGHEDLLAYLVRRLLENGANTSFVNRIADASASIADLVTNPVEQLAAMTTKSHPHLPLPRHIYGEKRRNSSGIDFSNRPLAARLGAQMTASLQQPGLAIPTGLSATGENATPILNPADTRQRVGTVQAATEADVESALAKAHTVSTVWARTPVTERAGYLRELADLMEHTRPRLLSLLVNEAGKTLPDAIAEVRETVDFCHYYAEQAERWMKNPVVLQGATGESNELRLAPRGPCVCISPWNFPLAIFAGQVLAAVVAGNPVLAKPAAQTPLIAAEAVRLMHEAGIPTNVVQLLPGSGSRIGGRLIADSRIRGVIFTGSTETARTINQTLAHKPGPITPFIAETGGQNAMIVDSTALPEQVISDVIDSAFGSAGQRCSALRILFLQEEVADKMLLMLAGAMAKIRVGNPALLQTDIGPVIDHAAYQGLVEHAQRMEREARLIARATLLTEETAHGHFFAPCAFEIQSLSQLQKEVFGPILHVIRYRAADLDSVIDSINATGYGLTLGVHTRINEVAQYIAARAHVGNVYVNRNMIGAVVGVQPFGGEGLSGTGPKAGGPHYLLRLCTERTLTINTTACGGNTSLLSL